MLVLLEGLDKTGKSTVADHYRKQRYEYIHMTAPAKHHDRQTYIAEMLHTIALTANKNVVIDRTWYGECIWPYIFNREALLSNIDCARITDAAKMLHDGQVVKIYMNDPDHEAHLARIVKFKEPTYDFDKARQLYDEMAKAHDFQYMNFKDWSKTRGS